MRGKAEERAGTAVVPALTTTPPGAAWAPEAGKTTSFPRH
jgi:hypothetical protein